MGGWIVVTGIILILLFLIGLYNRLITLKNRVGNAWSQIDVQLRRRHELIPNLVESVKGYMTHERGVIEAITNARTRALTSGGDIQARAAAENQLTRSLRSFVVQAEAIPELRASENMIGLQEELASTENRIAFARQHYNDSVMQYNTAIATVPSNLIAGLFAFRTLESFAADEADRQPVTVKF